MYNSQAAIIKFLCISFLLMGGFFYFVMAKLGMTAEEGRKMVAKTSEKVYVLGKEGKSLIKVVGKKVYDGLSMKDAILSEDLEDSGQPDTLESEKEIEKAKTAKITFRNKAILGRHSTPRWEFKLEPMGIKRADEPKKLDVLNRISSDDWENE